MNTNLSMPNQRLNIVDAFRGFALAGIVFVHMFEQYIAAIPPPELFAGLNAGVFDQVLMGFNQLFLIGKFFALFSLLFGLSFFIQMRTAETRGEQFEGRFAWRLLILLVIGYVHSLFYRGDILTLYALLGLALVLFYRAPTGLLLAVAVAIFAGVPRILVFSVTGGDSLLPHGELTPDQPLNQAYFSALTTGSLWDVMAINAWHGHLTKMEFQFNYFGRGYLTFGFFLVGLWCGRIGLFQNPEGFRPAIRKALWISILAAVLSMILTAALFSALGADQGPPAFDTWLSMAALTAYDLVNLSLTSMIGAIFLLVFLRPRGGRMLTRLAPYGRMALSNYVLQTLMGTFMLYHWGLGLIGTVSHSTMLFVAAGVIAFQLMMSTWWLRRFYYGPLEWLWRSATLRSWQPLRQRPVDGPAAASGKQP